MTTTNINTERMELAKNMRKLAEKPANQWTNQDRNKWDVMNAEYDRKYAQVMARVGRDNGTLEDGPVNHADFGGDGGSEEGAAIGAWLKAGVSSAKLSPAEERAASRMGTTALMQRQIDIRAFKPGLIKAQWGTTTGAEGGHTIREDFASQIEVAMKDVGGIMAVSETFVTSGGGPFRWPSVDDTSSEGEQVGEKTSVGVEEDEPEFEQQTWNAYKYSSRILKVAFELLEDSAFNLETLVARLLGERLGRIQARKFTLGTGTDEPTGIVTAAPVGHTAAADDAITLDDVLSLIHSIDQSRRGMPGVGFMFNDTVLQHLRTLKDSEGRYLWQPSTREGEPDRLWGYPYAINPYMASTIEADADTMLFGQLNQYKARRVNQLRFRRLDERYADTDEVGFLALVRSDGNLLDAGDNPVKKLTQASS